MTLKYYIDTLNNCTIRSLHGAVNLESFKDSMLHVWGQADYSIKQNHIIDLRDCVLELKGADLEAISEFMTKNQNVQDRRVALLVSNAMQAGISASYSDRTSLKHMSDIFVEEKKAKEYTNAPANIFTWLSSDQVNIQEFNS